MTFALLANLSRHVDAPLWDWLDFFCSVLIEMNVSRKFMHKPKITFFKFQFYAESFGVVEWENDV